MLYCEKCRSVCPDGSARCPGCKSSRLRPPAGDDMTLLHRADQYTAQRLETLLKDAGIPCETELYSKGRPSSLYDSEVMPTDKNLYVPFERLEQAGEISAELKKELDPEQDGQEEFEEMPQKKRIVVQILSALAFIVLVMLVVFGADAFANWLKSLLGI